MIQFWNRHSNKIEAEQVFGAAGVNALYGNHLGYLATEFIFSKKVISKVMGAWQNTSVSAKKIPTFIEQFKIPMDDYESVAYQTFNDFFIRKFKPGKRQFPTESVEMGAFAEARYFGFSSTQDKALPVKGVYLPAEKIIDNSAHQNIFKNGPCLLARLCPVDYHRFHYPDGGTLLDQYSRHGKLHSVNPVALLKNKNIFLENERAISILQTKNFGKLAYVEVGALGVGKIVQTGGQKFERGQEKGYFLFGGSTVIVFGEKNAWEPSPDILNNTQNNLETLIQLGSTVAKAK